MRKLQYIAKLHRLWSVTRRINYSHINLLTHTDLFKWHKELKIKLKQLKYDFPFFA